MNLRFRLKRILSLRKFNRWYDRVQEPWKLVLYLLFVSPVWGGSLSLQLGIHLFFPAVIMMAAIYFYLTRIWYVDTKNKTGCPKGELFIVDKKKISGIPKGTIFVYKKKKLGFLRNLFRKNI